MKKIANPGRYWYAWRDLKCWYTVRTMCERTRLYPPERLPKSVKRFIKLSEKYGSSDDDRAVWYRWDY